MEAAYDYNIIRKIGVLSVSRVNGHRWSKELNIISWNGHDPKFDIREWNNDHTMMKRGITLTRDELKKIYYLLKLAEQEEAI